MRLISIAPILLLICISQMQGQSGVEQNILSNVNPHWAQERLTEDQSMQVRQSQTYHEQIQLHLALVTDILIDRTAYMDIDAPTRQRRLAMLDSLNTYFDRSIFPINNKAPFPTPVFVDDIGTHCAVGYLLHVSGNDDIVGQIVAENNLAYIDELKVEYHELGTWANQYGFTIEELAWIQPQYLFFCNEGISVGEIIHNTCQGQCTGGFYADHASINNPPNTYLLWGKTYILQNGNWNDVGLPDCLCPGLYRQGFDVYTMEGDSLYTEYVEAEILGPEKLFGYWRVNGEAGLCQGYIEPDPMGGVPPYTYEVYDMAGNEYNLGPLCEGEYYFFTQDANGCSTKELVELYTPTEDCLAISVTDIEMNNQTQGYLNVTIFLEGDSTSLITLPCYAKVRNEEGNVVAWFADTLTQYGGTSHAYLFKTTEVSLPTNASVILELEFNYTFCEMPYYYTSTSTWDLQALSMSLSPNPFHAEATLTFNEVQSNVRLQIFNVQGQLFRTWSVNETEMITIDRGNLTQGVYTIQVVSEDKIGVERFVVAD